MDLISGDFFAVPLPDGFGALQVTAVDPDGVVVCLLDWHSAGLFTAADVADAPVLRLTHHAHAGGRDSVIRVNDALPGELIPVGNGPIAGRPTETNVHAGWSYFPIQLVAQRRWDSVVPPAVREAYRKTPNIWDVHVDLGAGPVLLPAGTNPLDLTEAAEVRWAGIGKLKTTRLIWSGPDRGLAVALADLPLIEDVDWREPPAEVDLAGTTLTGVTFGPGLRTLRLPGGRLRCEFAEGAEPVEIAVPDDGRWVSLRLSGAKPGVPAGLRSLPELILQAPGTLSVAALRALPGLTRLTVRWSAAPGVLTEASALAACTRLRELHLIDAYGLTADTLPDLPGLRHLEIDGLPRSVANALKARYRGTPVRLVVRGAKSDTWLRANLDNPFRDWADDDERAGVAACKAYATASRAVDRAPADAEQILKTLVTALNRIEDRYGIIDTLRREEAADAFFALAARAGVPDADADEWFDAWRDF
ncbi:hypothetical protein GCM10010168_35370 [Actinoplanes ianthinogenes]|uniref:Leucine rich repeat (LRR) protein n=1 Tax=Actinoplanes ianthinogenes TaxID=122358 RepID=A0ABN6CP03_9ACTN|nr:hypothetical protein [Actinoplanes ianthinogenes]BCJ46943.1 hypothetical protein Aiant_76000 [Actinoplanes ianthinogenes]GGR14469.1 hypothetical protein GCM10010168_35370 [Actinoplanes ianthinogenes]